MSDLDLLWEQLLEDVEDEQVIPIIGRDLLVLEREGRQVGLYELLAESLAAKLDVEMVASANGDSINAVACRYLEENRRADIHKVYRALRSVMQAATDLTVPTALIKLAEIEPLKLFVSTTFDGLMEEALKQVRGGDPMAISYSPKEKNNDLPDDLENLQSPVVYHLLGVLSGHPDYAVTEEDTLEFMHALQSPNRIPEKLMDELNRGQLLMIGCSFPDWLTRFLLRIAKGKRLADPTHGKTQLLADKTTREDADLQYFLKRFSAGTEVMQEYDAAGFVDELHRRWTETHPAPTVESSPPVQVLGVPADGEPADMEQGAIFLSYASEDQQTIEEIKDALEGQELSVWFDKEQLEGGDAYDAKIRRHIRNCSLFVPFISRNTLTGADRFFRIEWHEAERRAPMRRPDVPFILPVVIDETDPYKAEGLPDKFKELQWMKPDDFLGQIVDIFQKVERARLGATA